MKKLGDDHPGVADTYENMGMVYHYKLKKYKEALPLYQKALKIRKAKLGDEHPKTKKTMTNNKHKNKKRNKKKKNTQNNKKNKRKVREA